MAKKTTMTDVYTALKALQKLAWRDDDMMRQETLFEMPDMLTDLSLKVANECGKASDLAAAFPYLYRVKEC